MKLYRYIASTIISSVLLVTIVFFGLVLFISVVGEVTQTGDGNYHFWQAMHYVIFMLPLKIYQIFPMMVLVGVLLGLGSLSSTAELVVMRTSGLSLTRIAATVLSAALFLIIIFTLMGEGIAPQAALIATRDQMLAKNNGQIVSTLTGVWLKQGNDFFHIGTIPNGQSMFNITRFHFNQDKQLEYSAFSKTGVRMSQQAVAALVNACKIASSTVKAVQLSSLGRNADSFCALHTQKETLSARVTPIPGEWIFSEVSTTTITPDKTRQYDEKQVIWPLLFDFHQFADIDPSNLSLLKLYRQMMNIESNGINSARFAVIFWSRLFQPLMTLIMVLVAIPFIFGPLRSVSIGFRLLSGVTVGLIFYIANQFVISLGMAYTLNPILVAAILPAIFLIFALFLFRWKA